MGEVYLGIDYGSKRIGLSHADDLGMAFPMPAATEADPEARLNHIGSEIARLKVTRLVVGYPLSLEGERTKRCEEVDAFTALLSGRFGLPIELVDEGLTSQSADEHGARKPRDIQERRRQQAGGERDSRAAAILLQDFLNSRGIGGPG
ncbi:MAG: Holliday junction resolvase RuvX [Verrucomicrobiota bacterium]